MIWICRRGRRPGCTASSISAGRAAAGCSCCPSTRGWSTGRAISSSIRTASTRNSSCAWRYIGSPRQDDDFVQFGRVRREAEQAGMPLIMWAYPRGKYMEQKGGRDSVYAVAYAARVAQELGADVVKVNYPHVDEEKRPLYPKEYRDLKLSPKEMLEHVVASAGRTLVIMSGGSKRSDEQLLEDVRVALDAGVTGFIFGRNMWQRRFGEALEMAGKITKLTQAGGRVSAARAAATV